LRRMARRIAERPEASGNKKGYPLDSGSPN
jgi:hypothetical protein